MARPTHGYVNAAGEKIPGTTTIIGRFKESGGLIQWAYARGKEHGSLIARNLPAPKHLYDERDAAGAAGTIAHDMIEGEILGKPWNVREESRELIDKARNAFNQFMEWREQSKLEIVATEKSYVSEKHQFGGTVDAIGRDAKGRIVLLDWKTSNSVYSDMLIQLAAYALLLEECSEYRPEGFHLLRVSKENADFSHHFFGELDQAKRAFILMRELYDIDKRLSKRAA
jgi:hypothetical protein